MNRDRVFCQATAEVKKYVNKYMPGTTLSFIGLVGSQNYNLDDENSDFDLKAVVFLPLTDVIKNKTLSKVVDFQFGQVTFKDISSFLNEAGKGNPNTLEALNSTWTEWFTDTLQVARTFEVNKSAIAGMFNSNLKKYRKEKFKGGYHIYRMYHLLKLNVPSYYYSESIAVEPVKETDREYLMGLKDITFRYAEVQLQAMEREVEKEMKGYSYHKDTFLIDVIVQKIKKWYLVEEVSKNYRPVEY